MGILKGTDMLNKYGAKKTVYKGITYDSKWEAQRAYELDILQRGGQIKNLEHQKRFILQDGYVNNKGQKIRPISYIADFVYQSKSGQWYCEDTKSPATKTELYRVKKKMFEYKYPEYIFVETFKRI